MIGFIACVYGVLRAVYLQINALDKGKTWICLRYRQMKYGLPWEDSDEKVSNLT